MLKARGLISSDTPDADIVGANLYQRFIERLHRRRNEQTTTSASMTSQADTRDVNSNDVIESTKRDVEYDSEIPLCRNIPSGTELKPQTVQSMQSVLVCTGVYQPGASFSREGGEKNYHGHRDFAFNPALYKPTTTRASVYEAVEYILQQEGVQTS